MDGVKAAVSHAEGPVTLAFSYQCHSSRLINVKSFSGDWHSYHASDIHCLSLPNRPLG